MYAIQKRLSIFFTRAKMWSMYESFYSFNQKPFSVTSNPHLLYLSPRHKEALAHMMYGVRERVGFIEITGEVGTGKTTLCRSLLNQLDSTIKTAFIFNSNLSEMQLLQTILRDLGIKSTAKNKGGMFTELNQFLIEQLRAGNNVVVIVDEAQNLSKKLLEQIRMLSNIECENEKLLQIILVGQPELREKLRDPALRQLYQRIVVRYHIEALDRREVALYIKHRLEVAGSNGAGPNFDDQAINVIYSYSGGIPRIINILCDKALLNGFVRENRHITQDTIQQAIHEIEGNAHEHHQ